MAERLYPNATLFVEIIIFLAILFILSRYLFKPLLRVIEERKKRIDGERIQTARLRKEIEELEEDYSSKIAGAKRQANSLIESLKKEGEEVGKNLVQGTKTQNEKYFSESKEKIWKEASQLQQKLKSTAQEVSNDLASKILQ